MLLKQLYDGSTYEVLAYARSDRACQVTAHLEALELRDQKRVAALLSVSANLGPPRNREKCRKVKDESFWEFKSGHQRIFWCYDPAGARRIILLHGFTKKTKKTSSQALHAGREAYREVITEATEDGEKG